MSHAHGHMCPSALSPCRINQVYYHPTPDAIFVGFLTDMGIFSHPKSPSAKLQLLKLPPFQLRDSSNIGRLLLRPRQSSSSLIHITWCLLGASLSADNGHGGVGTGETNEIRRAGMNSLEIDEDVPESVARAINRWPIIISNDGDDDSSSDTPERFKTKHMQEEVGRLRKKSSTVAPRSCGSRESPDGACQLARTER